MTMKSYPKLNQNFRFKLCMFGVSIGYIYIYLVFCDKEGVVKNSCKIESSLDEKYLHVAYHYDVRNNAVT